MLGSCSCIKWDVIWWSQQLLSEHHRFLGSNKYCSFTNKLNHERRLVHFGLFTGGNWIVCSKHPSTLLTNITPDNQPQTSAP